MHDMRLDNLIFNYITNIAKKSLSSCCDYHCCPHTRRENEKNKKIYYFVRKKMPFV